MTHKRLTSVELFAGIGGFRLATDALDIQTIWANDLNPISATVYKDKFGKDGFFEGDIKTLIDQIPTHDLLTAGFPCQPFSAAGKKEGVRDPRGTLFQVIVEVLGKKRPSYFILENVKRLVSMEQGAHFATVLSALAELDYFIEWRVLNAKDFGLAQNRERVVITGSKVDAKIRPNEDLFSLINLADPDELNGTHTKTRSSKQGKHGNWTPIAHHGQKFSNWGVAYKGAYLAKPLGVFSAAQPELYLHEVLEENPEHKYDLTESTLERLQHNESVNKFFNGVEIISNQGGGARMGYTIFGTRGLAPTLTASTSRHYERYLINGRYRRLTPVEYARLQGFPDTHCVAVKGYDQYTLLGNAVPPPMIKWVLEKLIHGKAQKPLVKLDAQKDLFYA